MIKMTFVGGLVNVVAFLTATPADERSNVSINAGMLMEGLVLAVAFVGAWESEDRRTVPIYHAL